ncbi:MAG: TonB-dependent receptor, partial [Bacteroidetes bacterium]|nr:TonB-dependent receptor [Bacteroidota bacterium]
MKYFILLFLSASVMSQNFIKEIHGAVLSEEREPVFGAVVRIDNTTLGTVTDSEGKFKIKNLPPMLRSLTVSAIGFKTKTISADFLISDSLTIFLISSPVQTPTVMVTANKHEQAVEDVPVSVNILDTKNLERHNSVSLDDALRYVPGINFQQNQINIRAGSGYSRGVGSRVLLLIDGMPLLSGDTGEITFESLPVFQIDRIEVVKGAGSALYGSGALSGVINVLTKSISEKTQIRWKTFGGIYSQPSFREWKWTSSLRTLSGEYLGYENTFNKTAVSLSVQHSADDGYRESDWIKRLAGYGKIQYSITPYQSITFSTNLYSHTRADFLWWKDLNNALIPDDAQRNITVKSLRWNSSFHYKNFFNEKFFLDVKGINFHSEWYRDSIGIRGIDFSRSNANSVDVQGIYFFSPENILTVGVDANTDEVTSKTFGTHSSIGTALYLQDEYHLNENIIAAAGFRYDIQQVNTLSANTQINPKVGFRYNIFPVTSLRASFGSGFRSPSIAELFVSTSNTGSSVLVVPSTNLHPERSRTYEIGINQILNKFMIFDWALFQTDFTDLIDVDVQLDPFYNAPVIRFKNITQARIQGYEAGLTTSFYKNLFLWNIHYNYNWAIDRTTKKFLRFRPRHIAMSSIT